MSGAEISPDHLKADGLVEIWVIVFNGAILYGWNK